MLVGAARHLRPLAPHQPAQLILTRLPAVRTDHRVDLLFRHFVEEVALFHRYPLLFNLGQDSRVQPKHRIRLRPPSAAAHPPSPHFLRPTLQPRPIRSTLYFTQEVRIHGPIQVQGKESKSSPRPKPSKPTPASASARLHLPTRCPPSRTRSPPAPSTRKPSPTCSKRKTNSRE